MAPDIAVVGEVRDREALPLLLTLSSGVKGFTTIHASNARGALSRIRFLAELSEAARNLPHSALTTLVSEAVDLVVFSRRSSEGPQVVEIIAVEDLAGSSESGAFTTTELFNRDNPDHVLARTGNSSRRLAWMNKAER
jgi:pilus assembly protein CpaF